MESLSFMLLLVAFAVLFAFSVMHDMHMFQLNSYKPKVQFKWLKNNPKTLLVGAVLTVICALLTLFVKRSDLVRLIAAVPFPGQADRWPEADRRRYEQILSQCAEVSVVSGGQPVYYYMISIE